MTTLAGDDGRQGALIATLEPGEQLRWSGIPQSSGGAATFLPGCGGLIFLSIGLIALFLGWGSLRSDFAETRAGAPVWLAAGGGLTLAALVLLVLPFIWRARVRRSIWGVTDRRIVRVIDGKPMTIRPEQVERVKLKQRGELGTVTVIGHVVRPQFGGKKGSSRPVWHIPDVAGAVAAEAAIDTLLTR